MLSILSIVTSMAVPGIMSSIRRAKFEKTVAEVVTALERARTQALASELNAEQKIPPGGYGIYIDSGDNDVNTDDQKVVLFVDDWNDSAGKVKLDYADEEIGSRVLPDGKYTPDYDTELAVIEVNAAPYIQIRGHSSSDYGLSGTYLQNSTPWNAAANNKILVIFKPPYANTEIVSCIDSAQCVLDGSINNQLKDFTVEFKADNIERTLKFNRTTTTPQITKN